MGHRALRLERREKREKREQPGKKVFTLKEVEVLKSRLLNKRGY